jgi:cell shape-determining protein MreC
MSSDNAALIESLARDNERLRNELAEAKRHDALEVHLENQRLKHSLHTISVLVGRPFYSKKRIQSYIDTALKPHGPGHAH